MNRQQTPAIEIEHLSKTYHADRKQVVYAVAPLNLSVPRGQIFGFLGPNGAGKTTTIKMICGLVRPTTGRIRVNGYDIARERWMAMRQIGAVLEGTRNIHWRLTAWQNLVYFGRLKGCTMTQIKERGQELLNELGLWERRNVDVREFSRGMQQQVAIACALIADPSIILLDEPTLGLDIHSARLVKDWTKRLAFERGKTIILTTHQLDVAQALCDHIAIIQKGHLLANQPLDELLRRLNTETFCRIKVKGLLNTYLVDQFAGLTISHETEDEQENTVLSGRMADQTQLQAILTRLLQLNLPLLSVTAAEPSLEEVFISLIDGPKKGASDENHLPSIVQ
ncbi:MAG TPA: ABC transporter ATP-binding protein [Ktedonobacteraceae bacterium]|nr:ABC transporter ATP-binding protein [Ktedonobacteraceae bacterium]